MRQRRLFILVLLACATASAQNLNNPLSVSAVNGVGGTTSQSLAILTGNTATTALTTSTTVPLYIVTSPTNSTTGAQVFLAALGLAPCTFDASFTATPGTPAYVVASTTAAGQCHAVNTPLTAGQGYAGILAAGSTSVGQPALVFASPGTWQSLGAGAGTVTSSGYSSGSPLAAFSTSTNITPATYTNVIALWSSCSGSQLLGYDGTCHTVSGTGTVTGVTAGTGLTGSPTTITTSGTIALTVPVTVANGGTGKTTTLSGLLIGGSPFTSLPEVDGTVVYGLSGAWATTNAPNISIGGNAATASNLAAPVLLPNGTSATTQTVGDNSTDIATDAFVVASAYPTSVNQVVVSGVSGTACCYTGSNFGIALIAALTAETDLHTFDGSGYAGTQTWNTSGYLGVGGTGHIILPCSAINLSDSITMALRTGLYGCNPEGTNFNVQSGFPTKPTGGTVSTQNAASGGCTGNCVIGSGTAFVSGMSSIVIAGTPYSVVSVQSATLLTVATAPGSSSGQSYTADQPVITWGPGSTFAAPLSNFQVNCESGAADIGVNNAGSQENSTTTNVRTQDCPVANFQLSNTDGSINNHVQNIYMTNLNSLYINAVCAAGTRAFYSNTNGSGLYIDKATTVLGNSNVGTGCPNGGTAPTTVDEVNGPILAIDWHIEANAIGFPSMSGVNGISVGLTNAGNSHNDTFISTKFATANGGCGFKIFSAVTSFVAINTDISGTAGAGLHWSDSFCDSASGNTLTFANNPQVGLYALDSAGALFSNANTADSNLTGIFVYNNVISGWNGGTKNFSANALTGFLQANIYNPGLLYSAAGTPVPTCNSSSNGEQVTVSDLTTVAFNGAYVTGGSNTWPLVCSFNGSTYAWKVY